MKKRGEPLVKDVSGKWWTLDKIFLSDMQERKKEKEKVPFKGKSLKCSFPFL